MYEEFNEIVKSARCGELESVAELLERMRPLIIAQIRRYYNKRDDYDDLISQGNLVILDCLKSFDENKGVNFLGYIKYQLMYLYLDKHKEKIHISLNSPISQDGQGEMVDLLLSDYLEPLDEFLDLERNSALYGALDSLTPRQREIVLMFYLDGMSISQVSERLGIAYRTVVNTKTYALNKMKGILERI